MPKLARLLNRPVIVSIPAFFGDEAPRRCTLEDIEPSSGLWLSGESVSDRLSEFEDATPADETLASVFFPFDQIVYLLDPAQFAYLARSRHARPKAVKPAELPSQPVLGGRRDERPSKRGPKRKR
jgi:hypothetical protein